MKVEYECCVYSLLCISDAGSAAVHWLL